MKHITKTWLISIGIFILSSCTKEVQIDLNEASPKIIIEGSITSSPGPYQVQISKTIGLKSSNEFPAVSGATVIITDKTMNTKETLVENPVGIYKTSSTQGVIGHIYELSVTSEGQTYTAVSTMPVSVSLDSLSFQEESNVNGTHINATVCFQDPAGIANYYMFNAFGRKYRNTMVFGDRLSDGKYIREEIRGGGNDSHLEFGDTILVNINCVDRYVWDYFHTLYADGGIQSAAPANPTSNLSNNALGYFSAHAVQTKIQIVR
jgi:hypothetical protein